MTSCFLWRKMEVQISHLTWIPNSRKLRCNWVEREREKRGESQRARCLLSVTWPWLTWAYLQYSMSELKKRRRHYFHFYSRAAQHPPQSARWPKPCANPRSCSLMCPRKHTQKQQLGTHFSTTDFDVTNAEHIFPSDAHACMRLYFVHRDIGINRFVKLGLSSHIHRNHGIRCINAPRSWICIRQWCATRTEDYSWQKHSRSLPRLCSLTHSKGHNSSHPHTDTHMWGSMYISCWIHFVHTLLELQLRA